MTLIVHHHADPAWRPGRELPDAVTDRHPNLAAVQLTAALPVSLELTFLGRLAPTGERHQQRRLQLLFAGLSGLVSPAAPDKRPLSDMHMDWSSWGSVMPLTEYYNMIRRCMLSSLRSCGCSCCSPASQVWCELFPAIPGKHPPSVMWLKWSTWPSVLHLTEDWRMIRIV